MLLSQLGENINTVKPVLSGHSIQRRRKFGFQD